jgi:hypothetical protein
MSQHLSNVIVVLSFYQDVPLLSFNSLSTTVKLDGEAKPRAARRAPESRLGDHDPNFT